MALGIARNTLEKHFVYELSVGAYKKRLQVMDAMHAAAVKGNVAAGRAYLALTPKAAAPPPDPTAPRGTPAKPLGKKDQANVDAGTAATGTDWEDILPGATRLQ